MSSAAADRIRAMQEKGTITPEQAEELLRALETSDPEGGTTEDARAMNDGATAQAGGEPGAAQSDPGFGGYGTDWRSHRRRHPRTFLDMDWVGDMVEGITSSLGSGAGPGADWSSYGGDYRYEWDHRWSRQRGGNAENSSRVEQPEGESFDFQENKVVFSKLSGLRLVRAKIRDNSFSASTLRNAHLTDSAMVDSALAGASLHELRMDRSELKDVSIAGSKVSRLELESGSSMKNAKIAGSSINGLSLLDDTRIEDSRFNGVGLTACTLKSGTRVKDVRLNGTTATALTLQAARIDNTRVDGCTLAGVAFTDTEVSGCVLKGVALHDSKIDGSRIKDTRIEMVGFSSLVIEKSELKNVAIRDSFEGRFPRKAEGLSLIETKLENVQFVGCTFRNTTLRGVSASGLRIRGRDLTDRTITTIEELQALAE